MSKTTFTLKRKLYTKVRVGGARVSGAASPLPTSATSAFNQLPENFASRSTAVQEHMIKREAVKNKVPSPTTTTPTPKSPIPTTPKTPAPSPSVVKPGGWKGMSGWGKAGVIGLGAAGVATGLGLAAKGIVNKASEQSDGSKMFSQVNKNDMATTYTLKRKTYSEEDGKKSGMSTGGKIALGVGATAATTALAFAGARRGAFGSQTAMNANKLWASAGKKLGSQGMINSASNRFGEAMGMRKYDRMITNHKGEMTEAFKNNVNARANASEAAGKKWILDNYKIPTTTK